MNCVAVIGGTSSTLNNESFKLAARDVGRMLSETGYSILICGIKHGVIGGVLDSLANGKAPYSTLILRGHEERNLHAGAVDCRFFDSISERKNFIMQNSHLVLALPGGLGTHDEIISFLMGMNERQQILLININNYFDPFLSQLSNMVDAGLLKSKILRSIQSFPEVAAAIAACKVIFDFDN